MKNQLFLLVLIPACLASACNSSTSRNKALRAVELESANDSISYLVGRDIYKQTQGIALNEALIFRAYLDARDSALVDFDRDREASLRAELDLSIANAYEKNRAILAERNKIEGQAFLSQNKDQAGVFQTPSGLQYKVIEEGTGVPPTRENTVMVHYKGSLPDGTVFADTEGSGPEEFNVSDVIPGWTEALLLMKPGARWQLFVPSELAYGSTPPGERIPPNSVLVFEVQLLEILR